MDEQEFFNKIKELEKKENYSKFTVGDCYIDKIWNYLLKIVSIKT